MKYSNGTELSADEFNRINELFERKNWEKNKRFELFCKAVSQLVSIKERELILDLSERFVHIPLSSYSQEIITAVNNLITWVPEGYQILILNGMSETDYGAVKSSYLVSYQFKATTLKTKIDWGRREVRVLNSVDDLHKFKKFDKKRIVIVDDFIGSGESIEKALLDLQRWFREQDKEMPKYGVLSIVAMEVAAKRMRGLGVPLFCSHLMQKGITDYYTGNELTKVMEIMRKIENRFELKSDLRFGFNQSEALVCMERCPNNTFPFFWTKKRPQKERAPYER